MFRRAILAVALVALCPLAAQADGTLVGTWIVTAASEGSIPVGATMTITSGSDGYHVVTAGGSLFGIFVGGPTSASRTFNLTFEQIKQHVPTAPDPAVAAAVGRYVVTDTLTVSPDDTLTWTENSYRLNWYMNTGQLASIVNVPDYYRTTFRRVQTPPPATPVPTSVPTPQPTPLPRLITAAEAEGHPTREQLARGAQMMLARLNAERAGLEKQIAVLDRIVDEQGDSAREMEGFRQDLLQSAMLDAVQLAASPAFLRGAGLSPASAKAVSEAMERYHLALSLLASKQAHDEAERTGSPEARKAADEKALDASRELAEQLAGIAMPGAARAHLVRLADASHETYKTAGSLSEEHTALERAAIAVDGFSRYAAAFDPSGRVGALRSAGDVVAEGALYAKVSWDLQSVHDADNGARYARGLVVTRIDAIDRQRHAMQVQLQQAQAAP
jgi:hypothetical protein